MSSNKMRAALGRTILFDGLDSGILHSNLYLESNTKSYKSESGPRFAKMICQLIS